MRFLVTPTFTEKLASLASDGVSDIANVIELIKSSEKNEIAIGGSGLNVSFLDSNILAIKRKNYRIYASFGADSEGDYILLLDVAVKRDDVDLNSGFFCY